MRFVIFGLTISSSWGNGHATLWRGLCNALVMRGHRVTFLEKDVPYYSNHRDLKNSDAFDLILYSDWEASAANARAAINEADAAIVTSYCPDALAACEMVLDSRVESRVFYDLDSPVTLEALRSQGYVDYIPFYGLGDFDLVLSYAGGRALTELKTKLGARRVAPLYGSVDPDIHKPADPQDNYRADLSYLGTYAQDRQPMLDQLFLEPARRLRNKRFLIGGALYPDEFPWQENVWFVRHVPPSEHPSFYSSSNLTLSVTRAPMAEIGYCPSGRLFEAAACGAPIVSDSWKGLEEFFEPGNEILVASSARDVEQALQHSCGDLRKIGEAGRERVLSQHTAQHRAEELIELVEAA